jgi:hypothetical protein
VSGPKTKPGDTSWLWRVIEPEETSPEDPEDEGPGETRAEELPQAEEPPVPPNVPMVCEEVESQALGSKEKGWAFYTRTRVRLNPALRSPLTINDVLDWCCKGGTGRNPKTKEEAASARGKSIEMTALQSFQGRVPATLLPGESFDLFCYDQPAPEPRVHVTNPCSCLQALIYIYAAATDDPKRGEKMALVMQAMALSTLKATRVARGMAAKDVDMAMRDVMKEASDPKSGVDINCEREGHKDRWNDIYLPASEIAYITEQTRKAVNRATERAEKALQKPANRLEAAIAAKGRYAFQDYLEALAGAEQARAAGRKPNVAELEKAWERAARYAAMERLVGYANSMPEDNVLAKKMLRLLTGEVYDKGFTHRVSINGAPTTLREFLARPGGNVDGGYKTSVAPAIEEFGIQGPSDLKGLASIVLGSTAGLVLPSESPLGHKAVDEFVDEAYRNASQNHEFDAFISQLKSAGVDPRSLNAFVPQAEQAGSVCTADATCAPPPRGARFEDLYDAFARSQAPNLAADAEDIAYSGFGGVLKRGMVATSPKEFFGGKMPEDLIGKAQVEAYGLLHSLAGIVGGLAAVALDFKEDPRGLFDAAVHAASQRFLYLQEKFPGQSDTVTAIQTVWTGVLDMAGVTNFVEGFITHVDSYTGEPLDVWEQLERRSSFGTDVLLAAIPGSKLSKLAVDLCRKSKKAAAAAGGLGRAGAKTAKEIAEAAKAAKAGKKTGGATHVESPKPKPEPTKPKPSVETPKKSGAPEPAKVKETEGPKVQPEPPKPAPQKPKEPGAPPEPIDHYTGNGAKKPNKVLTPDNLAEELGFPKKGSGPLKDAEKTVKETGPTPPRGAKFWENTGHLNGSQSSTPNTPKAPRPKADQPGAPGIADDPRGLKKAMDDAATEAGERKHLRKALDEVDEAAEAVPAGATRADEVDAIGKEDTRQSRSQVGRTQAEDQGSQAPQARASTIESESAGTGRGHGEVRTSEEGRSSGSQGNLGRRGSQEGPPSEHTPESGGKAHSVDFEGTYKGKTVKMSGMSERKIRYVKRSRAKYESLRQEFDSTIRRAFLRDLAGDPSKVAALRAAGLTSRDIALLREGLVPPKWQVHHKIPLDDQGTNSFDNLVLIRNTPAHSVLTVTQRRLVGDLSPGQHRDVSFPVPEGFVYPPKPGMVTIE